MSCFSASLLSSMTRSILSHNFAASMERPISARVLSKKDISISLVWATCNPAAVSHCDKVFRKRRPQVSLSSFFHIFITSVSEGYEALLQPLFLFFKVGFFFSLGCKCEAASKPLISSHYSLHDCLDILFFKKPVGATVRGPLKECVESFRFF